jgi:hypothetical protein
MTIVRLERLGKFKNFNDLIGTRARDLPAYSIVPQPTMEMIVGKRKHILYIYIPSMWLVVRVSGYRSRRPVSIPGTTRFFLEVVGLEQGPLSLVSTVEELLGRRNSSSGLESREYGRRDLSH